MSSDCLIMITIPTLELMVFCWRADGGRREKRKWSRSLARRIPGSAGLGHFSFQSRHWQRNFVLIAPAGWLSFNLTFIDPVSVERAAGGQVWTGPSRRAASSGQPASDLISD